VMAFLRATRLMVSVVTPASLAIKISDMAVLQWVVLRPVVGPVIE
jgi:hypothetical protein